MSDHVAIRIPRLTFRKLILFNCGSLQKWSAHFDLNLCLQSLGAINLIIQENESCPLGFKLSQGECIDINECQTGTNDCMDSQRCENTIGSFICVR